MLSINKKIGFSPLQNNNNNLIMSIYMIVAIATLIWIIGVTIVYFFPPFCKQRCMFDVLLSYA